jgi:hypothetical protein
VSMHVCSVANIGVQCLINPSTEFC